MQSKLIKSFFLFLSLTSIILATDLAIYPQPKLMEVEKTTAVSLDDIFFTYTASVPKELRIFPANTKGKVEVRVSIEDSPKLIDLGLEAYLIEFGESNNRITAASPRGLYYAYQSFNQLVSNTGKEIPRLLIIDAPDYPLRGIIEGFYDSPWSFEARKDMLAFLGTHKMNTYVYAPKDDPYHREKWRSPYPADKLTEMKELVQTAKSNYVDFVFAISPGVSIQFTSEADWQALCKKTTAMIDIGVTHFALLLDDIDPNLRYAADRTMYKGNYALAQVELCNKYQSYLEAQIPGHRLIVVPTEYYQKGSSPYRKTLAEKLNKDIIVYSTGYGIVAETITTKEAAEIASIWNHDIVYWDNYPVNDYNRTRLHLSPLAGREAKLPNTTGFTFNPMNEAELSKLPLLTCADYTWNSACYDPLASWYKATAILGSDHKEQYQRFAEQNMVFFKDGPATEYPTLVTLFDNFVETYTKFTILQKNKTPLNSTDYTVALQGVVNTAKPLKQEFVGLAALYEDFSKYFPDAYKEGSLYLKRLENFGKIGQLYLEAVLLLAEAGPLSSLYLPDNTTLAKYGLGLDSYLKATLLNRLDTLSKVQVNSSSVIAPIFDHLSGLITGSFGFVNYAVSTNMPVYKNYIPSQAADKDYNSFFWSSRGQRAGDYLMIDLGKVEKVKGFRLLMSNNNNDYFHKCRVEISIDGDSFEEVALIQGKSEFLLNFTEEKEARYLKVTGESEQEYWVIIREFEPFIEKPKATVICDYTVVDIFNKIALEPFFVFEDELIFKVEPAQEIRLAALLQDPKETIAWEISYSLDGETFSEPIYSANLIQVLPLPAKPIKAIRFIPKEPGYLRGIIILPEK